MNKKLHNPKSHAPALYIPCWLAQVPNSLLSFAAKCLYGRLAQWSGPKGDVFRSYNQLAQELGSTKRSICDYVKELKDVGLMDTFQPQKGGLNHFVFYDHPWMYEPINEFLSPKPEEDPTQNSAHPHAESCATPTQNPARINKKEVKEIKNTNSCAHSSNGALSVFDSFWSLYPKKKAKKACEQKWRALKLDSHIEQILEKLKQQIENDDQWLRGYIPDPLTYLNQARWEDEIQQSKENQEAIKKEQAKKKAEEAHRIRIKAQEELARTREQLKPSKEIRIGKPGKLAEMVKSFAQQQEKT